MKVVMSRRDQVNLFALVWVNFLNSPQPSQEVGRFDGVRTYRNITASRNSEEDRIVPRTCEGKMLSQRPAVFARFRM